ncbi:MAG: TrmH family RNA methyltransferase [Holophagaceae bacterium]
MRMHIIQSKSNDIFRTLLSEISLAGAQRKKTLIIGDTLIQAWKDAQHHPGARRLKASQWIQLEGSVDHPLQSELSLSGLCLSDTCMRELTGMASPPNHALVVTLEPESTEPFGSFVVGAWGIQDPGNLGAIGRSALAFGCQEILLGPGTADPFSPKAIRGSMGASFLISFRRCTKVPQDAGAWIALDGSPSATPLDQAPLKKPLRLLVGNEGHGWQGVTLPPHVQRVSIPIQNVESLNAAVALGLVCFEVARREKNGR